MKKQSLNEHISRMKYLTQYNGKKKVNESIVTNETIDPNEEAAFEQQMTAALNQVMNDLPSELQQAATTQGNKDGQLDVAGQPTAQQAQQPVQGTQPTQQPVQGGQQPVQPQPMQEAVDEALVSLVGGTALALPAIIKLIGSASSFLGKKVGSGDLSQFGQKAKDFGDKMHHSYEHLIDKALSPLTSRLDPNKRKVINKLVFYAIIATFFGFGAGGAVHAGAAGQTGLAAAEGGLSSIKAGELVAAAREVLPKVLAAAGVS